MRGFDSKARGNGLTALEIARAAVLLANLFIAAA
jgi:hypothetical protein